MLDRTPRYQSYVHDIDSHEKNPTDDRAAPYKFGQPARTQFYPENSVPLFLSDYDGEPDPNEYITPLRKKRTASISSRILAGVSATAAAAAILFALLSSDATRDIIASAKASSAAVLSAASAAVRPNPTQLTAREIPLKDPDRSKDSTRLSAPENVPSVTPAAVAPTREDIKTAYQSALQGGAPRAAAVAELVVPGDAIPHLDPNEIASSLRRGDDLIASGDLAAARLVLRRAANAGDAQAAMMLAGTYDPVILAKRGVHGFVPDVAMARVWYEKAKKFGSAEAPQRLELLASKRQ
jgi:TPR repeat protein